MRRCLDSVKAQSHPDAEVIVIDNSRDPDFSARIRGSFPFIELYSSPQNLYYGPSLNKGIQLSRGEFILCLNDDVFLDKEFVNKALKGFLVKDTIGMVSGKILRPDGSTLDSTGLFLAPWRTARERGYGRPDKGQFEKSGFIFGVSGAAAFYRKKMLEEIRQGRDYFDPDFRMFYEDLDIAWRAKRAGWKGYYIPRAVAYHVRGGTVRKSRGINKPYARRYLSDELHSDLIKNRYLTIIKNASGFNFFLHLPAMAFYDFIMWAYILLFKPRLIKIFLLNLNCLKNSLKKRFSPSTNKFFRNLLKTKNT